MINYEVTDSVRKEVSVVLEGVDVYIGDARRYYEQGELEKGNEIVSILEEEFLSRAKTDEGRDLAWRTLNVLIHG